ncbi:hypothetical protein [Campylobacter cuniculorum]|uniref:hypothetical protein n=1 Tax=Campylobacter cuniculorum TaxID=374106 RepID=UPI0023F40602|nr:hypothetical protein [Campylobacter cuniculorum]
MTEKKVREILEKVLKEEEAKQEIIVKQIGVTPPLHNGVTSKTANFTEDLKDEITKQGLLRVSFFIMLILFLLCEIYFAIKILQSCGLFLFLPFRL